MKTWLAIVTACLALVGLWALPPSAIPVPAPNRLPESIRVDQLYDELARLEGARRINRWSDSLSAIVASAAASDGLVLGPPVGPNLSASAVRAWEERQRSELASLPRRDAGMTVGLFWQPRNHGATPGLPSVAGSREVTLAGERDGARYCIRTLPYTGNTSVDGRMLAMSPFQLGPCRLFASYGLPGEHVERWLELSALGFADVPVPAYAADLARTLQPTPTGPRLFGYYRPRYATEGVVVQACLAGRADACERALIDPTVLASPERAEPWLTANSPAIGVDTWRAGAPFGYLDDGLLFELEARYGPDAFARFWTSSAPVPEAFEAAFGVPLGDWVLDWVSRHVELYRAGPSLPASSIGWSLLALAALAAGASLAGVRRRLG